MIIIITNERTYFSNKIDNEYINIHAETPLDDSGASVVVVLPHTHTHTHTHTQTHTHSLTTGSTYWLQRTNQSKNKYE